MEKKYNVIVLGSGGRESALVWSISKSNLLNNLYCIPGNPGTSGLAVNIDADINDFEKIGSIALELSADIVIAGPEEPLVKGVADYFRDDKRLKHILFAGPYKSGAILEGSKQWAKEFMFRHNIPTAAYKSFGTGMEDEAVKYLRETTSPYVLKADGLAAGKGVVILNSLQEAEEEVRAMLGGKFGKASSKVVIEQFLTGTELSVFILTDGNNYLVLPEAKDYKRAFEGDEGPNTGGMGAVSPVPFADRDFMGKVEKRIIIPTVKGLKSEGITYRGFIFFGLISCNGDPYVIEYNVRMGDPETEAVLPRIKSDLLAHLVAAAGGDLSGERVDITTETAVTGVVVSGGYPGEYSKGYPVEGLDNVKDAILFHSGTKFSGEGGIVTSGGRVVAVTKLGINIEDALTGLYRSLSCISFSGARYRKDLGKDLLKYSRSKN